MTIYICFLSLWSSNQLGRLKQVGLEEEGVLRLCRSKTILTPHGYFLCSLHLQFRWGDMKSQEDHRKHWLRHSWEMLMPWFCFCSEGVWLRHIIWFLHASSLTAWSLTTCVSASGRPSGLLSLANHLGTTVDVYFGTNPIMHSCLFPLLRLVAFSMSS